VVLNGETFPESGQWSSKISNTCTDNERGI